MKLLKDSKLFYLLTIIIGIGLAIAIYNHISFVFYPIQAFLTSLFIPILIAVFSFYIFLPLYKLIKKKIKSDAIAIPIIFLIIIALIYFLISRLLPNAIEQLTQLIAMIPTLFDEIVAWLQNMTIQYNISSGDIYQYINQLDISVTNIMTNILGGFTIGLSSVVSGTIRSAIILFTAPLLLLFLFKDGEKLPAQIIRLVPKRFQNLASDLMEAFHDNAASYIGGRIIVCIYVGFASYLIFLILGVPNALVLGLITGIFDIIPYFGPFIGALPAFLVALMVSPLTALLLVIFITIVQLFESYLVTPLVMGKSLEMHPATVVMLVLFANELVGLLGMILILPIYAILKGCVAVLIRYYKEYKEKKLVIE